MASFPQSIVSFPTYHDYSDVLYAQNDNNIEAEVSAIEVALGTTPAGGYPTVRERFEAIESAQASVSSSVAYLKPLVARYEPYTRLLISSGTGTAAASGTLILGAINLIANQAVSNITFFSGSQAAVTPVNEWAAIFNSYGQMQAVSDNSVAVPWAANDKQIFPITTTAQGRTFYYTPPTTGLYYVGYLITAATPPSVLGITVPTVPALFSATGPVISAVGGTGLTSPPAFPYTASLTPGSQYPYASVV